LADGSSYLRTKAAYFFILPAVVTLVLIVIYPTLFAINASLRNWILYRPELSTQFIGLDNYITIFLSEEFWNSLRVTLIFATLSTGLTLIVGLAEALVINEIPRGKGIMSSLVILPLMISPVVVAFGWRFMYHEATGLVTAYLLPLIGVNVTTILGDPNWAILGVIAADVWNQTPLVFLILLAGLTSLPQEPFEAARVDGASSIQIFQHLTLPMLRSVILIALILRTIDSFKVFDLVWVMTSGGPGTATMTLVIAGYEKAFIAYRMGAASAYGIVILYAILALASFYIRLLVGRRK